MFDDLVGRREDRGRETDHRVLGTPPVKWEVWRTSPEGSTKTAKPLAGRPGVGRRPTDAGYRWRRRGARRGASAETAVQRPDPAARWGHAGGRSDDAGAVAGAVAGAGGRVPDAVRAIQRAAGAVRGPIRAGRVRGGLGRRARPRRFRRSVRALPQRRGGWLRRDPVGGGAIVVQRRCRHLGRQLPGADPMAGRAAAAAGTAGDDRRGHAVGPVRRGPDGRPGADADQLAPADRWADAAVLGVGRLDGGLPPPAAA